MASVRGFGFVVSKRADGSKQVLLVGGMRGCHTFAQSSSRYLRPDEQIAIHELTADGLLEIAARSDPVLAFED